ncbi:hypothetical protein JKP88DRAFT_352859 [Tribonema minus]|uniref:Tetratricopeptide repeat protein n=1 Tax=Tribonema minus TaxID=303371 RepID=A0A835ZBG4_9STRA|nr:hypothetical protein JKP88DRAFT_352859 [Tribonema minus]
MAELYPPMPRGAQGRFLNAGSFAGRAADLLYVFEEVAAYDAMPTTCDQRAMTKYFLEHPGIVTLDYDQDMFVTLAMSSSPVEFLPDGRFRLSGDTRATRNAAGVLHANANWGKVWYPELIAAWQGARRERRSITTEPPARFAGLALAREGRAEEALAAFRRAVKAGPRDADSHYNIGALLRSAGDEAGARAAYERALVADPAHANSLHNLALLVYVEGRVADAADMLRRAYAAEPTQARGEALAAMQGALRHGTPLRVVTSGD